MNFVTDDRLDVSTTTYLNQIELTDSNNTNEPLVIEQVYDRSLDKRRQAFTDQKVLKIDMTFFLTNFSLVFVLKKELPNMLSIVTISETLDRLLKINNVKKGS